MEIHLVEAGIHLGQKKPDHVYNPVYYSNSPMCWEG